MDPIKRKIAVDKKVLIEVMVLLTMGITSIVEGFRLDSLRKTLFYDIMGPGKYNIGIGLLLIIAGLNYFIKFYRSKDLIEQKTEESKKLKMKMVSMLFILGFYCFLIYIIGYLLATIVFFFLIFRVVGFKSWLSIVGLSIGVAISYYLVFVYWLSMVFPRGVLFNLSF